ncbi:MAG TPA: helicase HerA-like domain-containing protein, partial [Holophagaceae bacterium]|nr:helicase HerA-like domain-containing protein [Holophagaceae bacterium]
MTEPLRIAKAAEDLVLLPGLANRHGLVAGATGTGKTVTLQRLAESFSRLGVPVFMADVKGDLTGITQAGSVSAKLAAVLKERGIAPSPSVACPATLWDVYGKSGHPVRATVSEIGPSLLARMLELNDVQAGVLDVAFKLADEQGLLLLDLDDLRSLLNLVSDKHAEVSQRYGLVSPQSVAAIQRALLRLEGEGGKQFFGEPALELADLMRTDLTGR